VSIDEDQVAVATHEFGNELEIALGAAESKIDDSVEPALADEFEASSAEVFAEVGAEGGWFGGGEGSSAEQVASKELGMARKVELVFFSIGVEAEDDAEGVKLNDALNFGSAKKLDFVDDGGEGERIKGDAKIQRFL
jgi:hypothetical protein